MRADASIVFCSLPARRWSQSPVVDEHGSDDAPGHMAAYRSESTHPLDRRPPSSEGAMFGARFTRFAASCTASIQCGEHNVWARLLQPRSAGTRPDRGAHARERHCSTVLRRCESATTPPPARIVPTLVLTFRAPTRSSSAMPLSPW